jgi:hypothetical protein
MVVRVRLSIGASSGVGFSNVAILGRAMGESGDGCFLGVAESGDALLGSGHANASGATLTADVGADFALGDTVEVTMKLAGSTLHCVGPGGSVQDAALEVTPGAVGLRAARVTARVLSIAAYVVE